MGAKSYRAVNMVGTSSVSSKLTGLMNSSRPVMEVRTLAMNAACKLPSTANISPITLS